MDIVTYALLNGKIKNYASNVDEWLEENVDPATGYVLDRSLQMENAAAPADMVGDISDTVSDVKNTLANLDSDDISNASTVSGATVTAAIDALKNATGSGMASGTMGTGMSGTCYGIKINGICIVLGTVAIAEGSGGLTTLATAPIGYRPTAMQNCILGTYVNGSNFQTISTSGGIYTMNSYGEITQHMSGNVPAGTVAVYVFAFTI